MSYQQARNGLAEIVCYRSAKWCRPLQSDPAQPADRIARRAGDREIAVNMSKSCIRSDIQQRAGILKRIVGIQKTHNVALKQVEALVHGFVDASILRKYMYRIGTKRLDDFGCSVNHCISFSG